MDRETTIGVSRPGTAATAGGTPAAGVGSSASV